MKYQRLKKFLRTPADRVTRDRNICGVPYYLSIGGCVVLCRGAYASIDRVAYIIKTQDNSAEWRVKRDKLTSEAEYDIIRIG